MPPGRARSTGSRDDLAGVTTTGLGRHPGVLDRRPRGGPRGADRRPLGDRRPQDALQRLLSRGFETPDGERIEGLRELLDQLAGARRTARAGRPRRGPLRDRRDEDVLSRSARHRAAGAEAADSGDQRRQEVTRDVVAERSMQLDLMPRTSPARSAACSATSSSPPRPARPSRSWSRRCARRSPGPTSTRCPEALQIPTPRPARAMRHAMDALSQMLEQRERGRGPRPELRGVHGAVRRPVPGRPSPRRPARAAGQADGRRPGHVELDVRGAASPAPGPGRVDARGHGPALAGRAAGPNLRAAFPEMDWGQATASTARAR